MSLCPALCHLLPGSVLRGVVDPHFFVCTACGQPLAAPGDRKDLAGGIVQGPDQGWVLKTWHETVGYSGMRCGEIRTRPINIIKVIIYIYKYNCTWNSVRHDMIPHKYKGVVRSVPMEGFHATRYFFAKANMFIKYSQVHSVAGETHSGQYFQSLDCAVSGNEVLLAKSRGLGSLTHGLTTPSPEPTPPRVLVQIVDPDFTSLVASGQKLRWEGDRPDRIRSVFEGLAEDDLLQTGKMDTTGYRDHREPSTQNTTFVSLARQSARTAVLSHWWPRRSSRLATSWATSSFFSCQK